MCISLNLFVRYRREIPYVTKAANKLCNNKMSGRPAMNFTCFVLCRMSSIVKSIAADPPKAATHKSAFSEMRHLPFRAARLS